MTISKQFRVAPILLVSIIALSGCSGIHTYQSGGVPENVTFTPELQSGSVRMDVYDVDVGCHADYAGSVEPGKDPVKIGMPSNQQRFLVVTFEDSSFFTGTRITKTRLYFIARPGSTYDIKASYGDSMYNVVVREQNGSGWHEVPRAIPKECSSRKK